MILKVKANRLKRMLRQAKQEFQENLSVQAEEYRLKCIAEMESNLAKARAGEPFSKMLTVDKPHDSSSLFDNVQAMIDKEADDIWLTIGQRKFKLELTD